MTYFLYVVWFFFGIAWGVVYHFWWLKLGWEKIERRANDPEYTLSADDFMHTFSVSRLWK